MSASRRRVEIIGAPFNSAGTTDGVAGAPAAIRGSGLNEDLVEIGVDVSTNALAAVDYPQSGGLDWQTLIELTRGAMASPWLLGWDVTIYNPDLDPDAEGARRIVAYITSVLGQADTA